MAARNPFKPAAGSNPPHLVGRQAQLDLIAEGLDDGPGAPARVTIFTGARGIGKTVMLSAVDDLAAERGWLFIDETSTPGLITRLDEHLSILLEASSPRPRRRVTGVTLPAGLGGISTTATPETVVGLRHKIGQLLDVQEAKGSGLLITIDEVHASVPDLEQVAAITQHLTREGREFALVMAGLPSAVSDILAARVLTFLRRADKQVLGDVSIDEVQDAFTDSFVSHGRAITPQASEAAARATFGYPFLIQLIGYNIWRGAATNDIAIDDVHRGVAAARRKLGELVHETALADLSVQDRTFLVAMAADDGPSKMADIRSRIGGISPQHGNTYRERLLKAQMIHQAGHGLVDFSLPYLREFLREHGASHGLVPNSP